MGPRVSASLVHHHALLCSWVPLGIRFSCLIKDVFVCTGVQVPSGQRRASDPLEVEFQAVVSHQMSVLGPTETLHCLATSPALAFFKIGSHYVILASLELCVNQDGYICHRRSTCLCILSARTRGVCYHAWQL